MSKKDYLLTNQETTPFTPVERYTEPQEPAVREALEWFRDQKLALMMHWGLYSQLGIIESWPLVDADADWSRVQVDWKEKVEGKSDDEFKKEYMALNKSFNPVRFQPEKWADFAYENGFKYLIFTTKHHDGFCMYDSKYTDYKVTGEECPFHTNKNANVAKVLFDEFRKRGMGIAAYLTKPDFHCEHYWEDHGIGHYTTRHPTYYDPENNVNNNPEEFEKFAEYFKNQLVELVRDYGKVDIIWLDGGDVIRPHHQDVHMEDVITEARKYNPALIAVDRYAGGMAENYITPECKVPEIPLAAPWESCMTMGTGFSYRYDDIYHEPRYLIHLLLDIVAKGGNLALNIAPAPDGRLPFEAVQNVEVMGRWLKKNGRGVYGTRAVAPYKCENYVFTKKDNSIFTFLLYKEGENTSADFVIPYYSESIKAVKHLPTDTALDFALTDDGIRVSLPQGVSPDEYAEGFEIILK